MQHDEVFLQLITRNQRPLLAYITSLVPHVGEAEDVLQEVNVVLWKRAGEFQPDSDFAAWAFTIARYQVLAYRKRLARNRLHFSDDLVAMLADEAIETATRADARKDALEQCLERLDQPDRELMRLRYEGEQPVKELADLTGRSIQSAYRALARVHAALLRCIQRRLAQELA